MTQNLLAYVASHADEGSITSLRELVASLAQSRSWTVAPPTFVHGVDSDSGTRPGDQPIVTVGVLLEVSSPGDSPPTPVSEPHQIVDALTRFSESAGVDFEVELDGVYVGEIRSGKMDRLLSDGLLAQW